MERARGFTLIELLITITIMAILLGLAVVNFSGSLSRARDEDRKTDAASIAQALETLYKQGTSSVSPSFSIDAGTYPTAVQMRSGTIRDAIFTGLSASGRTVSGTSPTTDSIVVPATGDPLTFGDTTQPITVNQYAYIPIAINLSTGVASLCEDVSEECRQFIIRYKLEAGGAVQEIRSRYQ